MSMDFMGNATRAFAILLNLAVGGLFAGLISPDTAFPATMSVDYVRVYQLQN